MALFSYRVNLEREEIGEVEELQATVRENQLDELVAGMDFPFVYGERLRRMLCTVWCLENKGNFGHSVYLQNGI